MSKYIKPMCGYENEFFEECPACKGKIRFLREGGVDGFVSDILECDCSVFESENGLELMGNTLKYGNTQQFRKGTKQCEKFLIKHKLFKKGKL